MTYRVLRSGIRKAQLSVYVIFDYVYKANLWETCVHAPLIGSAVQGVPPGGMHVHEDAREW